MYPSPYAGSGAGAGGKIRRRPPTRAASTPYSRPPAAAAAHRLAAAAAAASATSGPGGEGGGGSGGWMSRLVDPASRLIAGGAARLFGSVFRKRLAPPPAPSPQLSSPHGTNNDPTQELPDSTNVDSPPLPEGGMDKGKNMVARSGDKALSEVEHLLMRKTFTRVEFDRLTDLLRARTIEPDLPTSIVSHKERNEGIRIDGIGGSTSRQMAADESPTVKVHSHGASSPAELAKQYMSSRYSREPQSSSLRSRLFLENKGEASNAAYDRRSGAPIAQTPIELGNENPGLPVNGYVTSGLRGRSAIYRMSRSPYFKAPSYSDVNTSSFSQRAQSLHVGGRQVLKRRGGDLENEVGSIGPIRRIRQKSNMMSPFRDDRAIPRGNLLTSRTSGSEFKEDSTSMQESPSSKRHLLGTSQSVRPLESHKNGDGKPSDSAPPIPAKSNKMVEKIFEQLNIIAPSPKEKQSGQQSVTGNASNSMSKKPILQDTGPSSMYDPSSSLKFQDLDGANGPCDPDMNGSLLKKDKLNMINDGPSKVAFSDKPSFLGNSVSASTSQKPGFKMAVIEDLPELDDDLDVPVPSKTQSKIEVETTERKSDSSIRKEQKIEQNILEQKVGSNLTKKSIVGSLVTEQPVASPSKMSSSGGLLSSNVPGKAVPNASVDNNAGFAFSNVPHGTRPANSVSAMPLASVNDDKQTGASNSIFGFKQSITSDLETLNARSKLTPGQSVAKLTTLDNTSSERSAKTEKAEDATKSSEKVLPSAASATLNAPLHFASAASTSVSLSNGFSHSSSPTLAADKPAVISSAASTLFAVSSSSPAISSSSPAFSAFNSPSSASVGLSTAEVKPASTMLFGIGGATDEVKSTAPDSASKPLSKPVQPISSSPVTSVSAFSPVAPASDAAGSATAAPSTSTAPGVQAVSFSFPSSGNSLFAFSSPAQSTGLSTSSVAGSTSQPSAASTFFGSKPAQSEGTIQQPSQSPKPQIGSPFPSATPGVGASSSGSGTLSFGTGASSTGSGTVSFGVGASSSTPGTSSAFGVAAPSSGPGIFSFAAGTSSSGSGTVTFGAPTASSGPGTVSFGAPPASSGPGTVSFGAGTSSSGSGSVPFGVGAASSAPGAMSFGAGVASSGLGNVSFGAGTSSSGPGTVSFGATTSGSGFGASPFGAGGTFANPFSSSSSTGFTFSSASSSAGASTVASTSVFASSTSTPSSASTFSNPFGSSSSSPSTFTFGQSASSGSGFAFGAQPAPTFSSQPSVFSFTSANAGMNSSTPQPAFGMTNTNTAFGMSSPGNDQMNEDSMADDTNQVAPAPAPVFGSPFGQQSSTPAAPAFGAPAVQPGGAFQFGGQQQAAPQNPSFPAAGSLEFQAGNFSLGSGGGGGDKSNRRMIKVKRTTKKR
ncbi:unnamed protein product [Urochloa decumbens]|uniref:Nuclear pore complex protein NUP1 n=1 Tax=Urochloa decumbens TaxID=240449 RepID=A0ABC8X1M9_9POAL